MKVLINEKLSEHKYKTPEGYLICVDAVLARTGKQSYRKSEIFNTDDNTEIEVDRQPNEVFSEATLASFENKPITVEHPNEDVNSGNIKEYAVGFVRDVHKGYDNGQPVILGTLVIQDAETIEEIENGEHTDLSCGYDCDINDEENPQQRNIRGNHVALCQCGRAGNARIVDSAIVDSRMNDELKVGQKYKNRYGYIYEIIKLGPNEFGTPSVFYKTINDIRGTTVIQTIDDFENGIRKGDYMKIIDSMKKDELYSLQELREMRIDNYRGVDLYKIHGQYSTNPNTSNRRFNTIEQVKEYIDNGFRDSIKDDKSVKTSSGEIHAFISGNKYKVSVWNKNNLDYDDFRNISNKYGVEVYKSRIGNDYIDIISSDKDRIYKAFAEVNPRYPVGSWQILDSIKDISNVEYYKGFIFSDYDKNAPYFTGFNKEKEIQKIGNDYIVYVKNGMHGNIYSMINNYNDNEGFTVIIEPGKIEMTKLKRYSEYNTDLIKAAKQIENTSNIKFVDSVKEPNPTYRSVWLKVKEYVKYHYNFNYKKEFNDLMNYLNNQYAGSIDEDSVYRILRDLNEKGYIVFVKDSEEKENVIDGTEYRIVNYNGKWYYEMKQDDGFVKLVGPYMSEKEAREHLMDEETPYEEVTENLEKNYDNFVEDDDISSLPDRIEKEKFNELYYKLRNKFENKWNYRVSTYGDKFKIEIEKAVGAVNGTYGPVGGKWKTVKTIYSKDSEKNIKDDSYLIQSKYNTEMYWQEDEHFGMSKKYAKKFNSYEEAAKKANIVSSDWDKHMNIIKDSKTSTKLSTIVKLVKAIKTCKDSVETMSEWIKKINGVSVEAAILKHPKGYTFRSSIIREDRDFNSYDYAVEYAKALNYKRK